MSRLSGSEWLYRVQRPTLGWSDLLFFAIFENGLIAGDQVYFYEYNFLKKSANFARAEKLKKTVGP